MAPRPKKAQIRPSLHSPTFLFRKTQRPKFCEEEDYCCHSPKLWRNFSPACAYLTLSACARMAQPLENMARTAQSRTQRALQRLFAFFRRKSGPRKEPEPGSPMDPYAYVGAPRKPRPYNRGAAAVAELPEE